MAKNIKVASEAEFRHHASIGPNGEVLYDAPLQIRSKADLDNYGITWDDCRTLNFHGSEQMTVYFFKTTNRAFAEDQWSYLDTQHSQGFASVRCMIPGTRKPWIKCPTTVSCAKCPHKADRKPPVISWDGLIETGYDPAEGAPADEQAIGKMEYQEIRALMDAEDVRIAYALEMKKLMGYDVKEIAAELGVSGPRIYQMLARAKAIGKAYRDNNR